jgi:integrase
MECNQTVNPEPEFIADSEQLCLLRQMTTVEILKTGGQSGHLEMAYDLLKQTLFRMYSHCNVAILIQRSIMVSEADKFSCIMRSAIQEANWSQSTARTILSTLKKILAYTAIAPHFLKRISLRIVQKSYRIEFGVRYGSFNDDHPITLLLQKWSNIIRQHSRNKSTHSIRNIIRFINNKCLPAFAIDINNIPSDTAEHIKARLTPSIARTICGTKGTTTKRNWLSLFLEFIMKYKTPLPDNWFNHVVKPCNSGNPIEQDDGSDKHRIPVPELEKLYIATEDYVLDRLLFMLLLTTGMRIGGLVKIKMEHVSHVNGSDVAITDSGRTLEKGSKWFTFMLAIPVKALIFQWITTHRPAMDSPYLFPGKIGHISTSNVRYRFKNIAKRADVHGTYVHPHAMRHTYGHMMLETGNTVETVAKLLGHVSSKTTEAFYLKESAVEVAKRANIPWLDKSQAPNEPVVPSFLRISDNISDVEQKKKREASQRRKKRKIMASLSMFPTVDN